METLAAPADTVHPEVRAHINSLVSALGGISADDDDGGYKLGDAALDVLRDIKKWIRFYDEKTNRMDVARCLADANIVGGDLLNILALWKENVSDNRFKARVALACYELMAPLTWPIEKNKETMTNNHHRHVPVLELAQLGYKRAIINFDGAQILHTAVRVALPSMAIPIGDRTQRDVGIIKLVLYFLRNVAMISPPPGVKYEGDESQVSRSATIDAFSYQDILLTILTIASNMGEDFKTEDVILMEIIFHLVKRVDIQELFLNEEALKEAKAGELTAAMKKEAAMLKSYRRKGPTRHNRFGTMLWVQRPDGKMSSLSGQDALADVARRERKMDESKTFKPPRRAAKEEMEPKDLGPPVVLNTRAHNQLRGFVEEFLDSGFNPLFLQVRRTIDRGGAELMQHHRQQFFYTVAWFLQAERVRQKAKQANPRPSDDEVGNFNLVASVLNQEMFITLRRCLHKSYTDGDWRELNAVMRCFTQILLTVQEMFGSSNEEDREIAENTLSRLFYEESTHDMVVNIVRTYKDQGFDYLDACTELTSTYLSVLEAYSKENVDMQIRSKRRTRRKKKATKAAGTEDGAGGRSEDEDDSANDEAAAARTSTERKFDFKKFANKFVPQGVVDTYVKFTKYYRDLDDAQLKRAHRYFHRVAFKQEMGVMLYRIDIIHLFYNLIKGHEPLEKSSRMYKEWEELVIQLIKRCTRKIEERPALIIEMLFSKINATAFYLEYGYERQTISSTPKPAAELEFRRMDSTLEERIPVCVAMLLDKNEADHIAWVKSQLTACSTERLAWQQAEKALCMVTQPDGTQVLPEGWEARVAEKEPSIFTIRPDNEARRTSMFKNPRLRLLMKVVGFERLAPALEEMPDATWIIPSIYSSEYCEECKDLINKAEFSPPVFEDDQSAEDQVKRKTAPRMKAAFDDDDNDIDDMLDDGDEDALFPANIKLAKPAGVDTDKPAKKKRLIRRREDAQDGDDDDELPDDSERADKARKRRQRELEKQRKIKSTLYVNPSDDETDDERDAEFFAREEALRQRVKKTLEGAAAAGQAAEKEKPGTGAAAAARVAMALAISSDEEDNDDDVLDLDRDDGTPAPAPAMFGSRKRKSDALLHDDDEVMDDDEQAAGSPPKKAPAKQPKKKAKYGFLEDSSSDDDDGMDLSQPSSHHSAAALETENKSDDEMETADTPLSSNPHADKAAAERRSPLKEKQVNVVDVDVDDEEDDVPVAVKRRPRVKGGFLMDSSDEE